MKLFECQACGQPLYFENRKCVSCGHRLGFIPSATQLSAVEPLDGDRKTAGEITAVEPDGGQWRALSDPGRPYIFCANAVQDACNWLIPADSGSSFCLCCRHNRTIPAIDDLDNLARWRKLELAKHHLFYQLLRLNLPHPDRTEDPEEGLAFDFLADTVDAAGKVDKVLTGHDNGLITINIAEADDATREKMRRAMGESYRTVLGHFRHEIGHYYWDRLVRDAGRIDAFRAVFGDESVDYGDALRAHYENGPRPDWQAGFITAYSTAHPWEDWAETWAHYLHIIDTLETARAFGLSIRPKVQAAEALETEVDFDPYRAGGAGDLIDRWLPLTFAVNSLNRSMGQQDLYPFVLSAPVVEKLAFINALVRRTL